MLIKMKPKTQHNTKTSSKIHMNPTFKIIQKQRHAKDTFKSQHLHQHTTPISYSVLFPQNKTLVLKNNYGKIIHVNFIEH